MSTRYTKLALRFWATTGLIVVVAQLTRWLWSGAVTYNAGLAFSWLLPGLWPIFISGAFLLLVGWWWYRTCARGEVWATYLGLVFGGGASNLLERLMFDGQVVDYINILGLTTANLADIAIIIGLVGALTRIIPSK